MKYRNTNWKALQVPVHRSKEHGNQWLRQGDVNVKQMSMGSWKARANQGGARAK